jgi:hypothetical protein
MLGHNDQDHKLGCLEMPARMASTGQGQRRRCCDLYMGPAVVACFAVCCTPSLRRATRLAVGLARADAALPAGVSVPCGPYRSLSRLLAGVWLDAAGLARRIWVCSGPAAAADAQIWPVVELWDFGVAVHITPPGPDEVLAPSEAYRLAEEEPLGRNA